MKTTIKTGTRSSVSVDRMGPQIITLELVNAAGEHEFACLGKHEAVILGNALIEHARIVEAEEGGSVRCHGDACAAGQLKCPTPGACGVKA
jgi:hypothetical protein